MNFKDILHKFRTESFTEREKGTKFERLMRSWLLTDPRYNELEKVWLWEDFPGRKDFGGTDTGIDLVAKTEMGDYWAIQCKCYAEDAVIDKPAVDSFLATSSRTFTNEVTFQTTRFAKRIWISTTNHWGSNAEEAIRHQDPPFSRVGLIDLTSSCVDWQKLMDGLTGTSALVEGKKPRKHQLDAISKAYTHYIIDGNDRGKLIMACGTGKTYTSLLITEQLLGGKGLVLFMVPSIALLGQSLNAWSADAKKPIKAVCICSDSKASRKIQNKYDDMDDSVVDLAVPASTSPQSIASQLKKYRNHDGLVVVFSTYQSIDAVSAAQQEILSETDGGYGVFDFIICDEAHRTTGVKLSDKDESNFTKIHSDDNVQGRKRLYMTATPRLYGESAKIKASEKDCILCSMDDKALYGEEFYRVNFSYAVQNGLLTDYKVLVLTVSEDDVPENIRCDVTDTTTELNFDDTSKLIGVINGLSKMIQGDDHRTWDADPHMMRRAVAFCSSIDRSASRVGIASKYVASVLPKISEKYDENLDAESLSHTVSIATKHIDGSMNSQERNGILQWLADEPENDRECRVVTNVRCLSEGVDVPSLDAVLFLSARNSQVDVVQSVGRVMRTFHKGLPDEKKYGYIIIPIVVPSDVSAEEALDNSKTFDVVWEILNALRSHDDRFNAMVNKIALNKQKPNKQSYTPSVTIGRPGLGFQEGEEEARQMENAEIARQLELRFGELQDGMYAKLVEKCGDRLYWENWAKEIGLIAHKFIERISKLIQSGVHKKAFNEYLKGLQRDLNPSVDAAQAIEMLAQHIITRPVFDALFADYQFVNNNAVSRSMQRMIDLLQEQAFEKDTEVLEKFYQSVRTNVGGIDNLEGKQTIIKNLYEKFFKGAFPLTVEKLGIVYTPVECVDFIIHSVNDILKAEFNTSLTEQNVHILDPFVGTGTFITRLLQSGLIRPEDMERKYLNEIHCNEIVLLAYYIADVNIESVFHDITRRKTYLPYSGICLTDTFQLAKLFPDTTSKNFLICVSGIGVSKDFTCIISDTLPDLELIGKSQCFPLYRYEENKNQEGTLFDDTETNRYIRRDCITDWILKEVRNRFGGSRAITKEHIFYYVYGLLHSKQYRERFADDLKKSLPRIPIVDNVQDFMDFYKAGKELADLHLNYEQGINEQITGQDGDYPFYANMPMFAHRSLGVKVIGDIDIWQNEWTDDTYQYFTVDKMKFAKVRDENGKLVADKTRIIYNGHITIENIPLKAYDYIVNGKSAIDWIMERYAVTIDKASQIKNDPNDWSKEHEQPRYILDLLLSVIILSCQTVDMVNELPKINL